MFIYILKIGTETLVLDAVNDMEAKTQYHRHCWNAGESVTLQKVENTGVYLRWQEYDRRVDAFVPGAGYPLHERGHHPDCQCTSCTLGGDAALWLTNPNEY